jgi:hypothetical protein
VKILLIKREPIGFISVNNGKATIHWVKTKKRGPCKICGKKTRDTFQGFNECKRCRAFEGFGMCDQCEYGISRSEYHCNGNDLEDHVTHYIACALRDHMLRKLAIPDFKSTTSAWHVSTKEKLKCFEKKRS